MITWNRPIPARAPGLREVVDVAVAIADAEGLPAVSMRRVATALRSGTASLYRIVESREEIVERMVDAVLGEAIPPAATGEWRADLAALARNRRSLLVRHPWLGAELAARPAIGPNALSHHEHALAAVAGLTEHPTSATSAVETLLAYVLGAAGRDTAEAQRTGSGDAEWRAEVGPYLEQVVDGYPRLRRMMREAEDFGPDDRFERGLSCVLDGIASQFGRR